MPLLLLCLADQLGVCRALSKEGLLPRIISGSSAGAMVAAHVCVRTDEELQQTLNAALAYKMGWDCEFSITTKLKNLLQTGYALGDVSKTVWLELLRWHCKGMSGWSLATQVAQTEIRWSVGKCFRRAWF